MGEATVTVERHEQLAIVTLNRPDKLNALSLALLDELHMALDELAADESVRCLALTGAGRGFCAGADLTDPQTQQQLGTRRPDLGRPLRQYYHGILTLLRTMPKPVIAAINGTAAGAGLNIALACDLMLAARGAKLIQAFINIGIVPDAGGTWTIPRLIGRARATEWMMSGEPLLAEQALEWGLLNAVVEPDALIETAMTRGHRMAAQPTLALAAIKRLMDSSWESDFSAQLELEARTQTVLGRSADAREGIMSFVQKRAPDFQGR